MGMNKGGGGEKRITPPQRAEELNINKEEKRL